MLHLSTILAAKDDNDIGKIVFPIIFVMIWIISAIFSAVNKGKEKARRERLRLELERQEAAQRLGQTYQPAPPPLPDAILRNLPNPMPAPTRAPQKLQHGRDKPTAQQRKFKVKKPKAPAARPQRVVAEEVPQRTVVAAPLPPARPVAAKPTTVTAANLHSWLKPATLKQQFILTEVLQPPKSLRGE